MQKTNLKKGTRLSRSLGLRAFDTFFLRTYQRGFSLVEMVFYTAILAVALVAVMQTLVVIVRSYGVLRASQRIEQEATASMERMVREIRDASNVDDAGSVLGSSPGELLLNTTDAAGTAKTVEFYLD